MSREDFNKALRDQLGRVEDNSALIKRFRDLKPYNQRRGIETGTAGCPNKAQNGSFNLGYSQPVLDGTTLSEINQKEKPLIRGIDPSTNPSSLIPSQFETPDFEFTFPLIIYEYVPDPPRTPIFISNIRSPAPQIVYLGCIDWKAVQEDYDIYGELEMRDRIINDIAGPPPPPPPENPLFPDEEPEVDPDAEEPIQRHSLYTKPYINTAHIMSQGSTAFKEESRSQRLFERDQIAKAVNAPVIIDACRRVDQEQGDIDFVIVCIYTDTFGEALYYRPRWKRSIIPTKEFTPKGRVDIGGDWDRIGSLRGSKRTLKCSVFEVPLVPDAKGDPDLRESENPGPDDIFEAPDLGKYDFAIGSRKPNGFYSLGISAIAMITCRQIVIYPIFEYSLDESKLFSNVDLALIKPKATNSNPNPESRFRKDPENANIYIYRRQQRRTLDSSITKTEDQTGFNFFNSFNTYGKTFNFKFGTSGASRQGTHTTFDNEPPTFDPPDPVEFLSSASDNGFFVGAKLDRRFAEIYFGQKDDPYITENTSDRTFEISGFFNVPERVVNYSLGASEFIAAYPYGLVRETILEVELDIPFGYIYISYEPRIRTAENSGWIQFSRRYFWQGWGGYLGLTQRATDKTTFERTLALSYNQDTNRVRSTLGMVPIFDTADEMLAIIITTPSTFGLPSGYKVNLWQGLTYPEDYTFGGFRNGITHFISWGGWSTGVFPVEVPRWLVDQGRLLQRRSEVVFPGQEGPFPRVDLVAVPVEKGISDSYVIHETSKTDSQNVTITKVQNKMNTITSLYSITMTASGAESFGETEPAEVTTSKSLMSNSAGITSVGASTSSPGTASRSQVSGPTTPDFLLYPGGFSFNEPFSGTSFSGSHTFFGIGYEKHNDQQ